MKIFTERMKVASEMFDIAKEMKDNVWGDPNLLLKLEADWKIMKERLEYIDSQARVDPIDYLDPEEKE